LAQGEQFCLIEIHAREYRADCLELISRCSTAFVVIPTHFSQVVGVSVKSLFLVGAQNGIEFAPTAGKNWLVLKIVIVENKRCGYFRISLLVLHEY